MKLLGFVIGAALLVCLALPIPSVEGQQCPSFASYVVPAWETGFNSTTCQKTCREGRVPGQFGFCHQCSQTFSECPTNKIWSIYTCRCECATGYHAIVDSSGEPTEECAPFGESCAYELISSGESGESSSWGESSGSGNGGGTGGGDGGSGGSEGGSGGSGGDGGGGESSSSSSSGGEGSGDSSSSSGSGSGSGGSSTGGGKKRKDQVQQDDDFYYGPEPRKTRQNGATGSTGSMHPDSTLCGGDSTASIYTDPARLALLPGVPGVNLPCGPHLIYDPNNCSCKCSPFWEGAGCAMCWWGSKNERKGLCELSRDFPLTFSPNEYNPGPYGYLTGNSGPGPNPGCNAQCMDLWSRDEETGLCTVCNPPRGTCPGFQVVDYTTCKCVNGPAPPAVSSTAAEEAESLLDCGPGTPNSAGTGCLCSLGFIGSRCNQLEEGWVPPFYVWSTATSTTPVCWNPSDPSATRAYMPSTEAIPTWTAADFMTITFSYNSFSNEEKLEAATRWVKLESGHDGADDFTCALTENGAVHCWQFNGSFTMMSVSSIPLNVKDIAVGGNRLCVMKFDGTAECVKVSGSANTQHFTDQVYSMATNGETSCVVTKPNREVVCQGGDLADDLGDFSTGALSTEWYSMVTVGNGYVCALVYNGTNAGGLACAGNIKKNPAKGDYYVNVKAAPTGDGRLCVTRSVRGTEMYTACWAEAQGFSWPTSQNPWLTAAPTTLPEQAAGTVIGTSDLALGGSAWMDLYGNNVYTLYHNGTIKGGNFSSSGNISWSTVTLESIVLGISYADLSVSRNHVCALASTCGGAYFSNSYETSPKTDCYCPLFKDGPTCKSADCNRYWISNNIVRSYVHTDYMKYCNMSHFQEPFCLYLQYFLDTNEGLHYDMATQALGIFSSETRDDWLDFPHPVYCPPAELEWADWKDAWEQCTGLDIMVYCDGVLLKPKEVRRTILPFNEHRSQVYDWGMSSMQTSENSDPNVYDYKRREGWYMIFGNDVDQLVDALELRIGEHAPVYKCLIEKLGTTAWEPEMFSSGCSAVETFSESANLGAEERKQYVVNLLQDLYGLSPPSPSPSPSPSPLPSRSPLPNPFNRPYEPTCNKWSFKAVPDDLNNPPSVHGMLGCTPEGGLAILQQNSDAIRFVFESGGDLRVPNTNPWSTIYSLGCSCVISSSSYGEYCTTGDEQFSATITYDTEVNTHLVKFESYMGVLNVGGYQYWNARYELC